MTEKILQTKKNGMAVLLLVLVGYVVAIAAAAAAGMAGVPGLEGVPGMVGNVVLGVAIAYMALAWILLCGLKVLKPQEALVLTLFGNYIGTLKGEGFYWVNPFCTAVNPAAGTRLSQSGDVQNGDATGLAAVLGKEAANQAAAAANSGKKISLKRMTLNNARQKINDCLGNPVEIGIAVIWQVKDTAKAVFNVDNYKEYLSLQCDSALRNVVRIYPYDVAPGIDTTGDGQPDDGSLRGSSEVVAERIRAEIQDKVGGSRPRSSGGPHHLPGLRPRDRRGDAAAAAGIGHHRRPQDDRGRRGGHGGNGPGAPEREQRGGAGRRAEGGYGLEPAGGALRQP